ncbi:hypothetical protein [Halalkalibacterium ligniniphilum]|uniref:hypothetical protein n=1 Tax=Halalkalibacterium ligniniphilum TaxID=1134413 RepID=UPI000360D121|nr:hypothetical protein [Halalkalibacterium ligniniphilum]
MSKNKWVRSISFNRTNPDDVARLRLIGKKSFSKYIKHLLDEELKRQTVTPVATTETDTPQQREKVLPPKKQPVVRPQQQQPQLFNPMLRR